jgi:hypothetical protein
MTTSEMMATTAASAQMGTELTDAVRAFIERPVCGTRYTLVKSPLYLRHPDIQPNVRQLMAPRADLFRSSLKAIVFLARIRTR